MAFDGVVPPKAGCFDKPENRFPVRVSLAVRYERQAPVVDNFKPVFLSLFIQNCPCATVYILLRVRENLPEQVVAKALNSSFCRLIVLGNRIT
jgi:hypothetical protein